MTMNNLTTENLHWLAGLLEGDGCFYDEKGGRPYPSIKIAMTDADTVKRVARLWDTTVTSYKRKEHKVVYETRLYGEKALDMMMRLYPRMGERRRAKIRSAAMKWWEVKGNGSR